jgi:poly(A) polymerase
LARLSRERIRQELLKLFVARRAVPIVGIMAEAGFVDRVLAGVPYLAAFRRLAEIEAGSEPPDALQRLAALGVAIPEDAERLAERLRLSNDEHARLHAAAAAWRGLGPVDLGPDGLGPGRLGPDRLGSDLDTRRARAAMYRLGPATFLDALRLAWARSADPTDAPAWRDLLRLAREWQPPRLALSGADVLRLGVPKGPAIGQALRHVEDWWVEADFPDDPARLRAALCRAVAEIRDGRSARPRRPGSDSLP